jgi:hypothetical protein
MEIWNRFKLKMGVELKVVEGFKVKTCRGSKLAPPASTQEGQDA